MHELSERLIGRKAIAGTTDEVITAYLREKAKKIESFVKGTYHHGKTDGALNHTSWEYGNYAERVLGLESGSACSCKGLDGMCCGTPKPVEFKDSKLGLEGGQEKEPINYSKTAQALDCGCERILGPEGIYGKDCELHRQPPEEPVDVWECPDWCPKPQGNHMHNPKPTKKHKDGEADWCEHVYNHKNKWMEFQHKGVCVSEVVENEWRFCPICGTPRPVNRSLEDEFRECGSRRQRNTIGDTTNFYAELAHTARKWYEGK